MALSYDPEIAVAVEAALAGAADLVLPPPGEAVALRIALEPFMAEGEAHAFVPETVKRTCFETTSADGETIDLYWYTRGGDRLRRGREGTRPGVQARLSVPAASSGRLPPRADGKPD